jgi:hypothetical protein
MEQWTLNEHHFEEPKNTLEASTDEQNLQIPETILEGMLYIPVIAYRKPKAYIQLTTRFSYFTGYQPG